MLTIGDRFPAFKLKAAVSLEKGKEFQDRLERRPPRQVEGRVLLAQGLHLRLPDGDRRVRQAQPRLRGSRRARAGRQHRQRVRPPGVAQEPPRPQGPAVPDAVRPEARSGDRARASCTRTEGVAMRATFIVDPEDVIRFVSVTDLDVGRNVDEVLRVLDALQTDELCPCNWQKGEPTLERRGSVSVSAVELLAAEIVEPARDIKLNLQSVLAPRQPHAEQRWGVAIACAVASRNVRLQVAVIADARSEVGPGRGRGRDRGGRDHGDEQRLLPVPPHDREAELRRPAGAAAHEPAGQAGGQARSTSSSTRWPPARWAAASRACARTSTWSSRAA